MVWYYPVNTEHCDHPSGYTCYYPTSTYRRLDGNDQHLNRSVLLRVLPSTRAPPVHRSIAQFPLFIHVESMQPGTIRIDRAPNGRAIFVRKKIKMPSAGELLANAFAGSKNIARRLLPFFSTRSNDLRIMPAPTTSAHTFSAPEASTSQMLYSAQTFAYTCPPNLEIYAGQPPQVPDIYPVPHNAELQSRMAPLPPQHFSIPHQPQEHLSLRPPPHPSHVLSLPALPPGPRIINPPRLPEANDFKYKCSICGRIRSPRYHYKHPIAPGELPAENICRSCRKTATDSDESFTSRRAGRRRYTRSRAGGGDLDRVELRVVPNRRRSRRPRRSASQVSSIGPARLRRTYRGGWTSDSRSSSRSSLDDIGGLHISKDETRFERRRSPSIDRIVDLVRHVHPDSAGGRRRRSRTRELAYAERRQDSRDSRYEGRDGEDDGLYFPRRLLLYQRRDLTMNAKISLTDASPRDLPLQEHVSPVLRTRNTPLVRHCMHTGGSISIAKIWYMRRGSVLGTHARRCQDPLHGLHA